MLGACLLRVAPATLLVLTACGSDGKPTPGVLDPCESPMAGVLGCAAGQRAGITAAQPTIEATCRRLEACGIIGGAFLRPSGDECKEDSQCGVGSCLPDDKGVPRCRYHYLDHAWCVARLTLGRSDPCGGDRRYGADELASIGRCIDQLACGSLGLPLAAKLGSAEKRPALDKYTCNNGKSMWTATVCDNGLLGY
ncbi:MAG: hypothetical protein IT371_02570 [Deltaproteobacteria bacterium]|nr:hypothetical protein [Deltaproteobacteria bacterium]